MPRCEHPLSYRNSVRQDTVVPDTDTASDIGVLFHGARLAASLLARVAVCRRALSGSVNGGGPVRYALFPPVGALGVKG